MQTVSPFCLDVVNIYWPSSSSYSTQELVQSINGLGWIWNKGLIDLNIIYILMPAHASFSDNVLQQLDSELIKVIELNVVNDRFFNIQLCAI